MARATTTLVLVAALVILLASASVARAIRTEPTTTAAAAAAAARVSPDEKGAAVEDHECEGAGDQEECMARRTLAAHTDYIYTQEHHN